jgi:hypothetical protein
MRNVMMWEKEHEEMAQRTLIEWRAILAVHPRVPQRNDMGDVLDRGGELPTVEKGAVEAEVEHQMEAGVNKDAAGGGMAWCVELAAFERTTGLEKKYTHRKSGGHSRE